MLNTWWKCWTSLRPRVYQTWSTNCGAICCPQMLHALIAHTFFWCVMVSKFKHYFLVTDWSKYVTFWKIASQNASCQFVKFQFRVLAKLQLKLFTVFKNWTRRKSFPWHWHWPQNANAAVNSVFIVAWMILFSVYLKGYMNFSLNCSALGLKTVLYRVFRKSMSKSFV